MSLIAGFLIGVALGMLVFHYVVLKQHKRRFSQKVHNYLHQMERQKDEIRFRQGHLNNYRFMEYNLSEALVVQSQIVLP